MGRVHTLIAHCLGPVNCIVFSGGRGIFCDVLTNDVHFLNSAMSTMEDYVNHLFQVLCDAAH
uniref:Uncharacterized protein n=1 Tax=Physcomitrium patens TaxID=3218 RepID=A0A2K1IAG0_PHYPA|nr:hypothetical protein PHYPA_030828 [Physcomitrium patens]